MALGWIIESNSERKLRFMAPNGTVYDDLREVCKLVTEQEEKARAGSGESKKKEPRVKFTVKKLFGVLKNVELEIPPYSVA
ncbi:hypothetical protein QJS10_CPA03g01210 [Acorus calamus]|uniref:Uncharacterized protein n=1 Tax=Acorus calamus TaxID=4465 RepID=A0AAV9F8J8_ACOCL|nr:hypothetical protein QJS10_CPA03g01210 [Acorus calamus]